jgi:transcriptional regulator with XRE-family HTH domain
MSKVEKFTSEPCHACGAPRSVVSGAWLRQQRLASGLTLREMARRLNFSAAYICDVEKNRRHCSPDIRKAYEAL